MVYRVTGSREDAADITQEAFLRVFARLDDLAGREVNLGAYLHRTARNLVYDHGSRRARERPTATIERDAGPDPTLAADPALSALASAQGADVRAANARLPERHRLVLALRELEGMSYAEIGRVLDITTGAVAQLLARARLALRRELRLEQVDAERMDPACRARLGYIGMLMDGELPADRAHALSQHVSLCPTCRVSRAAFEDAQVRYRAWLPLPVIGLGLGASTRARERTGAIRPHRRLRSADVRRAPGARRAGRRRSSARSRWRRSWWRCPSWSESAPDPDDSPPPGVTEIAGVPAVGGAPPVAGSPRRRRDEHDDGGDGHDDGHVRRAPAAGPVATPGGSGRHHRSRRSPRARASVAPVRTAHAGAHGHRRLPRRPRPAPLLRPNGRHGGPAEHRRRHHHRGPGDHRDRAR